MWFWFFKIPWTWLNSHCCFEDDTCRCIITTSRRFDCVFLKWLIPLDVVAWRLSLFLWALLLVASETVWNNFGFIQFDKGEIFWKETSKRLQKTVIMLQLRAVSELTCEHILLFATFEWFWSNHRRHFKDLASLQRISNFVSLKCHYDENHILSIKAILKHKQVACMRRKTLFTFFKYMYLFVPEIFKFFKGERKAITHFFKSRSYEST